MPHKPVELLLEINVEDIYDINDHTMDYSVKYQLKQWYQDERLKVILPHDTYCCIYYMVW